MHIHEMNDSFTSGSNLFIEIPLTDTFITISKQTMEYITTYLFYSIPTIKSLLCVNKRDFFGASVFEKQK